MSRANSINLAGFLAAAFAVVAMLGVMASYVAPLPLQRTIAREAALDEALAAAGTPNEAIVLKSLAVPLGDSADALTPGPSLPARIAAERLAMRARLTAEAEEAGTRMRWMIIVGAIMAASFGALLMGVGRNTR